MAASSSKMRVQAKATRELNSLLDERLDAGFCDTHFGDDGGLVSWGFQYLYSRRPKSPDTVFILLPRETLSNSEFAKSTPHPDIIAGKTKFSTAGQWDESGRILAKEYQTFFGEEFLRLHKPTKVPGLDMSEDVSVLIKQMRSETEPRSAPTGPRYTRCSNRSASWAVNRGRTSSKS